MEKDSVLLRCSHCGTLNRVQRSRLIKTIRCGSCKEVLGFPRESVLIDESRFDEEVLKWPGAVLVEFYSDSCGYCHQLDPVLKEIAREKAGILKVVQINTARAINLAPRFQLRGVPSMYLYDKGRLVASLPGFLPKPQLENWLQQQLFL